MPDLQMHGVGTAGDAIMLQYCLKLPTFMSEIGQPNEYGLFGEGAIVFAILTHPNARGSVRLSTADPTVQPILRCVQ